MVDVADVGCGTGRLAIALAARGYRVTGADPAAASLALARAKPGAAAVTWLNGDASALPSASFDAVVMTSHVAQFMLDDFPDALAALHRALRPGGHLFFDTRDPAARGWTSWTKAKTQRTVELPEGGTCTMWGEVTNVDSNTTVSVTQHYMFSDGDHRIGTAKMRFRTEGELRAALGVAGFTVERIYGGWNREPIGHPDGELLVTARRS